MTNLFAFATPTQLVHLSSVDVIIVVFYFALVLGIGFYLRGRSNTGEDFFMAGREMTAWVAGLSFLSANLGALELMDGRVRRISTEFWRRIGTGLARFRQCCSSRW